MTTPRPRTGDDGAPDRARAGDRADEIDAWAASGAMWLTGPSGSPPLGPPAGMVTELRAVADVLHRHARALGTGITIDPLALLGERAAIAGLSRRGTTSCGGATRLFPARDGWMALTLARPDDVELVPAWLETDVVDDVWATVTRVAAARPSALLVERARLLGLPAAALPASPGEPPRAPGPLAPLPVRAIPVAGPAAAAPPSALADLLVVDLSSLWAGPLCGGLLAEAGARVVKVESTTRPDGARRGPAAFFDLLNHAKQSVGVDLRSRGDLTRLRDLLHRADVVIEASRPRALTQLGIDAEALVAAGGPRVWVSITAHGRSGPAGERVGFGDDAAVAGGLVSWNGTQPCFCADAIADPTTGVVAAAAALDALVAGGRWLLDVAMAGVARRLAGPSLPARAPVPPVARPRARPAAGRAPRLGQHTGTVLAELELAP
ncbi:MAG: CoA transferase [Acidimicrobiales bacterium]|nr:CoA transferase [Acidimicrobiales bacterium]